MKTLEAEFDIVTPMFLGDADQHATRIRESSIKGALAFWWRAKNFAGIYEACGRNLDAALRELQRREGRLFGTAVGKEKGRGKFDLRVVQGLSTDDVLQFGHGHLLTKRGGLKVAPAIDKQTHEDTDAIGFGARYLGYGVITAFAARIDRNNQSWDPSNIKTFGGQLERSCFHSGRTFSLRISFRTPRTGEDEEDIQAIENTIRLFGLIGGLGSRVRRGWGAVSLRALSGGAKWIAPLTADGYKAALVEVLGVKPTCPGGGFPLSAFASETRIQPWEGASFRDELAALEAVGNGLLRYRAHGPTAPRKNMVGDIKVEASFIADKAWYIAMKAARTPLTIDAPARTAFGLPHNYAKDYGVTASEDFDRRASPLLFHIHKCGAVFVPLAIYMPTKFLSGPVQAWKERERKIAKVSANYRNSSKIITDYLDNVCHNDDACAPVTKPHPLYFPGKDLWS